MNKRQTKKYNENMKLKKEILKARSNTSEALQFLVDIGSKKHRAKYKGSNKDLSEHKAQIIDFMIKEITTAALLRHVCNSKKGLVAEADQLMEDIFK